MLIQPNTQEVVYITIRDMTFYIDCSMDEPIVSYWKEETWKEENEVINLIPEKDEDFDAKN